jgi:hypothetical protein
MADADPPLTWRAAQKRDDRLDLPWRSVREKVSEAPDLLEPAARFGDQPRGIHEVCEAHFAIVLEARGSGLWG